VIGGLCAGRASDRKGGRRALRGVREGRKKSIHFWGAVRKEGKEARGGISYSKPSAEERKKRNQTGKEMFTDPR